MKELQKLHYIGGMENVVLVSTTVRFILCNKTSAYGKKTI